MVAGGNATGGSTAHDGPLTASLTISPASVPVSNGTVANTITVHTSTPFPAPLTLESLTATDTPGTDVALYTNPGNSHLFAYVAGLQNISIIDVTDPVHPVTQGSFASDLLVQGGFNFDHIAGNYLVVGSHIITNADNFDLLIYDLTNPLNPSLVSNTPIPYPYLASMVVEGSTLLFPESAITFDPGTGGVLEQHGQFLSVDISDPSKPRLASVLFTDGSPPLGSTHNVQDAVAVNNQIAYAASTTSTGADTQNGTGRLLIVDTTNPANLTLIGTLDLPGRVAVGITPHGSHRSGLAPLRHPARQVTGSLHAVTPTRAVAAAELLSAADSSAPS